MNELLEDLKNEIESCRISVAGGNNINVDDALNTLKELKEAITVTPCCTELKCEGCKNPLNSGLCGSCCSDLASNMY
jgi:hypothetical protein